MTEIEKRRITLLQQTRKLYSEKNTPPAIHPRYKGVYQSIYKNETTTKEEKTKSSFGTRFFIALLLFGVFVVASYKGVQETEKVVAQIQKEPKDYGLSLEFVDSSW